MEANTASDILILLLGHKDCTLVILSEVTFLFCQNNAETDIYKIQPQIVAESSANLLRIPKTLEFDSRPENGLLLILFKPSKQTAEHFFKMDLKRYLRNPSYFILNNHPYILLHTPSN